jgi:hypothetical protein
MSDTLQFVERRATPTGDKLKVSDIFLTRFLTPKVLANSSPGVGPGEKTLGYFVDPVGGHII